MFTSPSISSLKGTSANEQESLQLSAMTGQEHSSPRAATGVRARELAADSHFFSSSPSGLSCSTLLEVEQKLFGNNSAAPNDFELMIPGDRCSAVLDLFQVAEFNAVAEADRHFLNMFVDILRRIEYLSFGGRAFLHTYGA